MRLLPVFLLLFVVSCARKPSGVFVDPAFVPLLPADTTALLGLRLEKIKQTPLWRQVLPTQEFQQRIAEFKQKTSFDPAEDLRDVLFVWNGKEFLVMARGKFSPMGLEPKIEREGVQRLHYKGYPILGDENSAVLFVNTTTAVAGRTERLRRIIDARDGSQGAVSQALLQHARQVGPENQIWGVTKDTWLGVEIGEAARLKTARESALFDARNAQKELFSTTSRLLFDGYRVP